MKKNKIYLYTIAFLGGMAISHYYPVTTWQFWLITVILAGVLTIFDTYYDK